MTLSNYNDNVKLFFFSFFTCLITFGFALANFSVCIDGEYPIYSDFAMSLGRWGLNLIRYHIFDGYTPYFTLVLGLVFMSLASVELTKLFKLKGISAYLFCALSLSFPQLAYQLVFIVQADAFCLGYLLSVLSVKYLLVALNCDNKIRMVLTLIASILSLAFALSIYQSLIFIPALIFLILFLNKTFDPNFTIKGEIKFTLFFIGLALLSVGLYSFSVYVLCPPVQGGYLESYTSGEAQNPFAAFFKIWKNLLLGKFYYGNKTFLLATILFFITVIRYAFIKKWFFLRLPILVLLMLIPFLISFFIPGGYHPPRIYSAAGLVFAFIIVNSFRDVDSFRDLKLGQLPVIIASLATLANIYFVTELYFSHYRIGNLDKETTRKIDLSMQAKYPEFNPKTDYIYFHGCIPTQEQDKFRLPESEIFGGSFYNWDGGNNYRIISFARYNGIADYRMVEREPFMKIKDSIAPMPLWPNPKSIKFINGVMIVKLGENYGVSPFQTWD